MDIAINPKLLTDFRLGYYRYNIIDTKIDQGVDFATRWAFRESTLGDNFTSGAPGFIMQLPVHQRRQLQTSRSYGDGLSINRCNCPLTEREDQFQIVNNWTKIMGNHTIKIGADLRYARNLRVPSDTDRAGQMNFKTGPTSNAGEPDGLGLATFMLGDVTTFGRYVGNATSRNQRQGIPEAHLLLRTGHMARDPQPDLNLGLRWELYFPESRQWRRATVR